MRKVLVASLILVGFAVPVHAATCAPKSKADFKEILVSSGKFVGNWKGVGGAKGKQEMRFKSNNFVQYYYQGWGRWNKERYFYHIESNNSFSINFGPDVMWKYRLKKDCSIIGGGNYANDPSRSVTVTVKPRKR